MIINYLEKTQIAKQRKYRILRNYGKPRGEYIIFCTIKVNKLSLHMISIFIFNFSNYICRNWFVRVKFKIWPFLKKSLQYIFQKREHPNFSEIVA